MTPPFTASTIFPCRMAPLSRATLRSFMPCSSEARRLERNILSSLPSMRRTTALIVSPMGHISTGLKLGSWLSSLLLMYPSDFCPISTWTPSASALTTLPSTNCPRLRVVKCADSLAAVISSAAVSCTSGSLFSMFSIATTTSLMIHSGVEAPAATPAIRLLTNHAGSNWSGVST
ncbi:MAG: hypothetical protein DDT39_01440 [Firmicutes bacterium]|nr:hypothetical protein [candidate division NPL-UPA2 bacterium]